MSRKAVVFVVLITFTLHGCDFGRRFVNKRWGLGSAIPALLCGGVGAGAGWVIQNNRPGCTAVNFEDSAPIVECDDKEQWKGALIGGAIGLVLCGALGHMILDPDPPTPTLPPPPPLPTPTPPPLPSVKKRIVLRGVNFDFDRSDIRADSRPVLEAAVSTLRDNPAVSVAVEGHTDGVGSEEYNQELSLRRANAVYRYLVAAGINPGRLQAEGFGKSRPVATNDSATGRAQNRRVELRVLDIGVAAPPPAEPEPAAPEADDGSPSADDGWGDEPGLPPAGDPAATD